MSNETIDKKVRCMHCYEEHYMELEKDWEEVIVTCPHCDKLTRMNKYGQVKRWL